MKNLILLVVTFIWLALTAFKQNEPNKEGDLELTVVIENIKKLEGKMGIRLTNPSNKTVSATEVEVTGKTLSYTFENLKGGKYAVQVMHDANSNGELDVNFFGIPTEAYGFSNNAMGSFGPPKLEDQLFELEDSKTITIKVH